jgi:Ni/Co efflux regulator RcnB
MKRILMTGLSALTLMGGFAGAASAQDYGRYNDQNDGRDGRGDWNRGDWNRGDNDRRDNDRRGHWDNRGGRDQFNRQWRRGDRLPNGYERHFRGVDYRYSHLRAPPRGYRYVRDDRGQILLVGLATGVILSAIFSNY